VPRWQVARRGAGPLAMMMHQRLLASSSHQGSDSVRLRGMMPVGIDCPASPRPAPLRKTCLAARYRAARRHAPTKNSGRSRQTEIRLPASPHAAPTLLFCMHAWCMLLTRLSGHPVPGAAQASPAPGAPATPIKRHSPPMCSAVLGGAAAGRSACCAHKNGGCSRPSPRPSARCSPQGAGCCAALANRPPAQGAAPCLCYT
jgi:hypothetical protein